MTMALHRDNECATVPTQAGIDAIWEEKFEADGMKAELEEIGGTVEFSTPMVIEAGVCYNIMTMDLTAAGEDSIQYLSVTFTEFSCVANCDEASFTRMEAQACTVSSASEEGSRYRYYSHTTTTLAECAAACCEASDCVGFEHPLDNNYCWFWLNSGEGCSSSESGGWRTNPLYDTYYKSG